MTSCKYISTRGVARAETLEDTLFSGFLSDNGLFVPETIEPMSFDVWQRWKNLTYPQIVGRILELFMSENEIPTHDIQEITERAFQNFNHLDVIPIQQIDETTFVAELFRGPTFAFKDLAMSVIGQLLEYFLSRKKKHIIILVGTSGDTGSAAIECVRKSKWADIVVLYPKGRCSTLQELQMTSVLDENVHILAVDGTSDDLDQPIRALFADREFVRSHNLCSINSINWVRVLVQVAHYFYIYLQVVPNGEEVLQFVIPTGACGNLTSGVVAKHLGLPIELVAAVNANQVIHKALTEGVLEAKTAIQTVAPAMDIQVPYNFERLLYLVNDGDHALVKQCMNQLEKEGRLLLDPSVLEKLQATFSTCTANDEQLCRTIKRCWDENGYLICPHTAAALTYHYQNPMSATNKRVCLATASPEKFPEAVKKAGIDRELTQLKHLYNMKTRFEFLETGNWERQLREKIQKISELRGAPLSA